MSRSLTIIFLFFLLKERYFVPLNFDERIVGGWNTTIEKHPYQVSVQILGQHSCGGSLIAPKVLVTAAHCTAVLAPHLDLLSVRAGSTIRNIGGQVIPLKSIHDHPKYDDEIEDYDVSVLVLEKPFELGPLVQIIPLYPVNVEVPDGELARVTGWGSEFHGGDLADVLQALDVAKVEQEVCIAKYPKEVVSDRMHCFGGVIGKDTCQGDSGGPLVVEGKLAGVISWGYDCGGDRPGVCTKISNEEITNHIMRILTEYGRSQ